MSFRRNSFDTRSTSVNRQPQPQIHNDDRNIDLTTRHDPLPNIIPELVKIVRKLLPKEIPLNIHVRDVEYIESGCERLSGTLYMTTFRLVFAPDNEIDNNNLITSDNKYIGEYDIPLTSIYKINIGPTDTQSGFTSYLTENQSRLETRTFSIITRDFRYITFAKCSPTKSNTLGGKQQKYISIAKIETYVDALKFHSRFQKKEQLYPYLALYTDANNHESARVHGNYILPTMNIDRSMDEDTVDFCSSQDERIRSYMTYNDWREELYEAEDEQWIVDRQKFDKQDIIRDEGPYVCLVNNNNRDGSADLIWHWTHTAAVTNDYRNRRQVQSQKYMLITIQGIGEITMPGDPLRRVATDTGLVSSAHYIWDQPIQRYNLAKFPCTLQRLQTSYKKLIEICVLERDEDDEKWWTKLNTCKWLKYVSKALHGAASLAKLLDFKNIELAGSETDHSCLMSSLIQILLRPKCRTIKGFCELIVREWIMRGHRFRERFGQCLYDTYGYPAQEAPVFLLFLDCVHQLIVQNPFAFEFTNYLLIELYHSVCYCYHHTFVFNHVIERLDAIRSCPKDLLVLSSFDFSLYLDSHACRLLKNEASIFNQDTSVSGRVPLKTGVTATVVYPKSTGNAPSPVTRPNRMVYHLESPKLTNPVLDIPVTNGSTRLHPDQYEYDAIESPQIFSSDLHVDWRTFNLELWSQCYCRYDQNYLPTWREQQLLIELNSLKDEVVKAKSRSKRNIILDTFHSIGYANSWHPQSLNTRF